MDGYASDLQFNPSKVVFDKDNNKLFGFIVRQQGRKLIVITEIYIESRRDEIISKTKLMAIVAEKVMKTQGIDRVCVVDVKDINEQLIKHNIDPKKFDIEFWHGSSLLYYHTFRTLPFYIYLWHSKYE